MNIFYRKATLVDIPTIISITKKTWFPTYEPILPKGQPKYMFDRIYSEESLKMQLLEEQDFIIQLLAGDESHNEPVAFASYSVKDVENKVYKLNKLYLLPDKQGLKLGQKLLAEVEKIVQNLGAVYLDLNVNRDNKAQFFYEKCGFEVIETVDIPFDEYFLNDYIMRKKL